MTEYDPEPSVRDRVATLPDTVWDCERCGKEDSMVLRRSSLNEQFHADDVSLKCMNCWHVVAHGIPFDDPEAFLSEFEARSGRVYDIAADALNRADRLAALGYLSKSEVE